MRAIAEEAFAMVREYKGSHSGEHGDGLVRSEFHERDVRLAAGARLRGGEGPLRSATACSIPARSCGRRSSTTAPISLRPGYRGEDFETHSTGRPFPAPAAVSRARSRCATTTAPAANSPAARCAPPIASPATSATSRAAAPTRCGWPSPASSAPDALASDEMARDAETVRLLQGLPARMPDRRRHGAHEDRGAGGARASAASSASRDRLVGLSAALCAPSRRDCRAVQFARSLGPALARWSERLLGFAGRAQPAALARGSLRADRASRGARGEPRGRAVRRHVQRDFRARKSRRRAAVLVAAGYRVHFATPAERRAAALLRPHLSRRRSWSTRRDAKWRARSRRSRLMSQRGVPIVGLEPSCLLTFRDELPADRLGEPNARGRAVAAVGGIPRPRAGARPAHAAARAAREEGAAARPLPSEEPSTPWARSKTCSG